MVQRGSERDAGHYEAVFGWHHAPAHGRRSRGLTFGQTTQAHRDLCIMAATGQEAVRAGLADHLVRLWRYALVLSGRRDVAEDLVQATCLRALERAHQFEAGSRLDSWLVSILHSVWLNEVRARRIRQGEGVVEAGQVLSIDGAGAMEAHLLAGQLLREVATLPEGQRMAVFLVYGEGVSYREAAEILAVPIGTVMSRLAAARLALGHRMGGINGEGRSKAAHR
jgi:RNA polymerase sigma-70 factor (ECF subfamily)